MMLFKDKINYKLPGGNGFAPHLDAPAYDHISKVEHVTANIAIHPADVANGCLEVVPGSHKMPVEFITGGHITQEWCDAHTWVPVPLGVGDMLVFGSHLAHRSGPNTSTRERAMLYATYSAESDGKDLREKYYSHRRVAFPPDHGESPYLSRSRLTLRRTQGRCRLFRRVQDVRLCCAVLGPGVGCQSMSGRNLCGRLARRTSVTM